MESATARRMPPQSSNPGSSARSTGARSRWTLRQRKRFAPNAIMLEWNGCKPTGSSCARMGHSGARCVGSRAPAATSTTGRWQRRMHATSAVRRNSATPGSARSSRLGAMKRYGLRAPIPSFWRGGTAWQPVETLRPPEGRRPRNPPKRICMRPIKQRRTNLQPSGRRGCQFRRRTPLTGSASRGFSGQ